MVDKTAFRIRRKVPKCDFAACAGLQAEGRIVSMAVIIAVGVNSDGRREVLGMDIGASETESLWTGFLRKLARRGLRGVKLVISETHDGGRHFPNEAAIPSASHPSLLRRRGPLASSARLVGAVLLEQNDEWSVQRSRYMTLGSVAPIGDDRLVNLPLTAA